MQFRLRTLIGFIAASGALLALVMWLTTEWRRRVGIGNELKAQGAAWVGFAGPESNPIPSVLFHQPIPEGFHPEERLRSVELKAYDVKPECLSRLSRAGHMDRLFIISCDLSDEDVQALQEIEADHLLIWNAKITDASIPSIARVRGLGRVTLVNTSITQRGVQELLSRLPHAKISSRP
jgi:hypothetical protein